MHDSAYTQTHLDVIIGGVIRQVLMLALATITDRAGEQQERRDVICREKENMEANVKEKYSVCVCLKQY